ncbi:MAG: hypothetical protein ABIY70_07205, partial [Capsulimonas sp.]|uniref:hypothetical protein n=1 Tax=Capsulimonas sp. TaxID=2494211 RepID=UPI0032641714
MPVPYRKTPRAAEIGLAAYLDILWLPADKAFYGGLLIIDGLGQPQEFVHNTLAAPSGLLWTPERVRAMGLPLLSHSLFDACRREPDLLVGLPTLGSPEYCAAEIAPALPFAQVVPPGDGLPAEWNWINTPPTPGMRAAVLSQELVRRGFLVEPFDRLH